MREAVLVLVLWPALATACTDPVCTVAPDDLRLTRLVDFEDLPNSMGIGVKLDGIVGRDGVSFGERLAGQSLRTEGDLDRLDGRPQAPLALEAGEPGGNLGSMRLPGNVVLHGLGHLGFPQGRAAGEGAIAILFDRDQPALSFVIAGGEGGTADVAFYTRQGRLLHRVTLGPLTGQGFGFHRPGFTPDIAGLTIENDDVEGIAIDDLRFEADELMGGHPAPLPRG